MELRSEPLEVVCIKASNRLIKGEIYECTHKSKSNRGVRYYIKDVGSFSDLKRFQTKDGKSLNEIEDFDIPSQQVNYERLTLDNLKVGDFVLCRHSSSKYISMDTYYQILDIKTKVNSWDNKVRLESIKISNGRNNYYQSYGFVLVDLKKARELKLKSIGNPDFKITSDKRKWENFSETKKLLTISEIFKSITISISLTKSKNKITSIDDFILERGKSYNMIKDDIEPYRGLIKEYMKILSNIN